ncbi:MAG: hypothetical protein Q9228_004901 [Teloschistes exilis]
MSAFSSSDPGSSTFQIKSSFYQILSSLLHIQNPSTHDLTSPPLHHISKTTNMRFASTLAILSLFAAPLSILAAPAPAAAPVANPEPHYGGHHGGFKKGNGNHGSFTGSFGARPTDFDGQGQPSGGNGAQPTFQRNGAQASFAGNGPQVTSVPGSGRNGGNNGNGAGQTTRVRGGTEATTTADDVTGPTTTS